MQTTFLVCVCVYLDSGAARMASLGRGKIRGGQFRPGRIQRSPHNPPGPPGVWGGAVAAGRGRRRERSDSRGTTQPRSGTEPRVAGRLVNRLRGPHLFGHRFGPQIQGQTGGGATGATGGGGPWPPVNACPPVQTGCSGRSGGAQVSLLPGTP